MRVCTCVCVSVMLAAQWVVHCRICDYDCIASVRVNVCVSYTCVYCFGYTVLAFYRTVFDMNITQCAYACIGLRLKRRTNCMCFLFSYVLENALLTSLLHCLPETLAHYGSFESCHSYSRWFHFRSIVRSRTPLHHHNFVSLSHIHLLILLPFSAHAHTQCECGVCECLQVVNICTSNMYIYASYCNYTI